MEYTNIGRITFNPYGDNTLLDSNKLKFYISLALRYLRASNVEDAKSVLEEALYDGSEI